MALLGGNGMGPHRTPVDDTRWNEAAEEFAREKRKSKVFTYVGGTLAAIVSLVGVTGLVLVMTSNTWEASYDLGVLLGGLAVSFAWLIVPAVLGPALYQVTQDAVVEPSSSSRRLGGLLTAAATAPSVLHAALLLFGSALSFARPDSHAVEQFLGPAITPLRVIMVAVPVLLALALYPRIRRADAQRARRKSPWSIGE